MKNEQLIRKSLTRFFLFRKQMIQIARIMAVLTLVFLVVPGFAQNQLTTINGTVVGADDGSPIPGATIVIKGTSTGTVSNIDGHFTLQAKPTDVLEVSFIGYTTQTIPLNGKTSVTITMKQDIKGLDEVVVIGYGVQKKKLVTGATASVEGDNLQKLNAPNALQALQGQAAGVNITSTSGQPGGGFKVNIRGVGTIGNSSPLYVVDGVITNDITYLNNSDIATIDILKDAASCAIYGVNGANGVVLITTKGGSASGRKGGHVTFDAYYGLQNVPRKVDLLNAQEYATMQNEAAINSGKGPLFTQEQINALGTGTNWMDEMFSSNVPTENYDLSASGGTDVSTYSLGLSYTSQGGIVGGSKISNYDRYNFRANTERKLYNNKLKVGEHLTFSFKNQKGIKDGNIYNNSFRGAFGTSPLLAMYGPDGNFLNSQDETVYNGGVWYDGEVNPYAMMVLTNKSETKTQTLVGDVYAELEPVKNLKLKTTFGLNYSSSASHSYLPAYGHLSVYSYNDYETITQNGSQGYTWNWDNTVNYNFSLNDHKFDILGGMSVRKYTGSWMYGSNKGTTLFGNFDRAYLSNSEVTTITMSPSSDAADAQTVTHSISLTGNQNAVYAQESFFGRINYDYKETYLASVVFRADGSTMFAKGHQWGYFPSVSLGWVMSNAPFMESTKNVINFLKIRGSWGTNGNDAISAFNYLSLIKLDNAQYNFGNDNSTLTPGSYPSTIGVENTQWETSYQTDLGFDAQFLNNRMSLNVDFYNKTTKNWLIAAPLLATAGVATNPYINGGDVTNKGVEIQLSYNNQIGKDFHYNVSGSFAYNKNEVNNIPTEDGIIHGGTNSLFTNAPEFFRASAGNPIGYFWGYKTAGVFQNEADVQNYTSHGAVLQPNAQPGDVKYVDLNGDGEITADDKTNIGDPNPHEVFGLSFSCNYKNVDFSVTTNGVAGNKIAQSYRSTANSYDNWTSEILTRWHGEGTSNRMPRVTQNNVNWVKFSDLYIHDGSYLRVSNISLGYDLAKVIKWNNLSEFHFYVAAQNLFTFTKYNGMDPEVGYSADDANGTYSFGQGVDLGFYPRPKTYMVGVNIKF
ncbi:SusC/RagA family TonB-linked outer membrane protein [Prolixibacter bellariivorans]|nr:TonB-dependent receptor [Prolixibacter bellariivorans]